ncbi:signal peptidase II [Aidingimonas halophila]|uniref:Lipoprotein signal peptidase n=2 Tax=Aidingimonas halophila TaxID=574349 RepID=A0A1H3HK37_9GAMM|nr:signal peptidase II [Aidingimonas halophila]
MIGFKRSGSGRQGYGMNTRNDQAPPMVRPLRWLWLSVVVIALDLGTKALASHWLNYADPVTVLPVFDLTLLHNTGAAFSFLADHAGWQRWFFATVAVGASVALTLWMRRLRAHEKVLGASLGAIIGGALGNLYDRMVHGYVIDFLSFHWGQYYFPAFNLADTAITLGAIGLIWESFRDARRKRAH